MDRASHSYWNAKDVARLLALVENERRYFAELTADLPVAVAIVSSELDLLLTNRAFRELFQLKSNEVQSVRLGDLESGPEIAVHARTVFASKKAADLAAAGAFRISLSVFRGTEDPGQELLLVVHPGPAPVVQNSEAPEYDAIFWSRGVNLNLESVSPQIEEILGYTPDRFLSDPGFWIGTVHPNDRTAVESFYRGIAADGRYHIEYRASDAKGNLLRLRDAVKVRNGRMIGLTLDVSNRGLLENDQLQTEKFESLSRLARRVTHDFNNLQMVIKGYGDEVLNALPPEESSHADMKEILGATTRLTLAVEKLDVYIRRPAANSAPFDINQFLEKFARGLSLPHGVEASLDLLPLAAPVRGDAENLEKILTWLFTLDAGGQVRIATSRLKVVEVHADKPASIKPGDYTALEIGNSGPPLDSIAAEPILLRAHTVMRSMGGGFDAAADARGNTFRLFLPSTQDAGLPLASVIEAHQASQPAPSKTVLVVEDEPGIRALIRKMLLRRGYQVLEAQSGTEGLQTSTQFTGKIDLLITDLLMPQMNGRELVDKLMVARPQTKVLFISGFTDDPLLDRAGLPPGVVFLQKPFTLESLLRKVDEALKTAF